MSARSFRQRLNRLERSIKRAEEQNKDHIHELQNKDRTHEFTIDPASAEALLHEAGRLHDLDNRMPWEPPLTVTEIEEKRRLRECISNLASKIALPPGYGRTEAFKDHCRLNALRPRLGDKVLTDAEVIEEMQLKARIVVYKFQSPEGQAWTRIRDLQERQCRLGLDEFDELIHLIKLHPPLPLDPNECLDTGLSGILWDDTLLYRYQQERDQKALRLAERKKKYPERFS
jgi:hypothetical protein